MKIKRITAFLIDLLIVSTIASVIFSLPFFEKYYNNYYKTVEENAARIADIGGGSTVIDEDVMLDITYNLTRSSQPLYIINIGCTLIYFGVISFVWKGQTIGKRLLKLQVVSNNNKELNPNLFMLRQILVTNLIPKTLSVISIIAFSKSNWYVANDIISYLSNTMTFIILGFMIFRNDERGLHDLIGQTKVISTKQ